MARSLSDMAVRDETKEVQPDARPQAWKNRRRIRWSTDEEAESERAGRDCRLKGLEVGNLNTSA